MQAPGSLSPSAVTRLSTVGSIPDAHSQSALARRRGRATAHRVDVALERPPSPADHGGREVTHRAGRGTAGLVDGTLRCQVETALTKSTSTDYTRRTLPETSQSKLGTPTSTSSPAPA